MTVITLSRQIGSGGDEVAVMVADRLRLRLIGRDIINQASRQAGVPEVALAEIDELGLLGLKPSPADSARYAETVTGVIRARAAEDNVLLVGRGGQVALSDWPGVLRVRILAPLAMRVHNVQESCQVSEDIAAALVETRDKARAGYLQKYFDSDTNDPLLYDVILNMTRLSVPAAAEIICQAAAQFQSPAGKAPA